MPDILDTDDVEQPSAVIALPDGVIPDAVFGRANGQLYAVSIAQLQTVLAAPVALPQPAPPTFTGFTDTNAGGSVTLVPAQLFAGRATGDTTGGQSTATVPMADYRYKIGSDGVYAAAPSDGVINVGNIEGQVFAYSIATSTRAASLVAASPAFTFYNPPTTGLPTPAGPTFTAFKDTDAGGSVQLVPALTLLPADYVYKVGAIGSYQPAPIDGVISVGNVDGAVYAYSPAVEGTRNQSPTAVSPSFTAHNDVIVTVPGAPTNAVAVLSGASISVNATAPASNGGAAITGYSFYRNSSSSPLTGGVNVARPFLDTTVVAGTPYSYEVAAVNSVGTGPKSPVSNTITTPDAPIVPGAPTIGLSTAGVNQITTTATAPTTGGTPTSYNIYRNGSSTALFTGVTTLSKVDNTAVVGTFYSYQWSAVNSAGEGPKSAASAEVTPTAPAPPSFNTTYSPGDNISTVTYNGADGTLFKANLPLSTNTDPNPATMLIFAPGGSTQLGQVDYSGWDTGVQCGYVYGGTTYVIVFTNGSVTLA